MTKKKGVDSLKRYGDVASDIKIAIHEIFDDTAFIENWPIISLLPHVSHNGEMEVERKLVRILNQRITEAINQRPMEAGILTNTDVKSTDEGFSSLVKIDYGEFRIPRKLGKLVYSVEDTSLEIVLQIEIRFNLLQSKYIRYRIDPLFPSLAVAPNPIPLEDIHAQNPLIAIIDFEWINYMKPPDMPRSTHPEQVSEFAILAEGNLYHSDYLEVEPRLVQLIHKKLLEKQGITVETLLERHTQGNTMIDEFQNHIYPLLAQSRREKKPLLFLYFGKEDGVILQQLFSEEECEEIHFVDFTALYHIRQLGQEAILNGLGVEFSHTFDPAMDVLALQCIAEVFTEAKTVEDSHNLQNAILVKKMLQSTQCVSRVARYQQLILNHPRTFALFEHGLEVAKKFETLLAIHRETQESKES